MEVEGQVNFIERGAIVGHQLLVGQVDFADHHAVVVCVEQGAHLTDEVVHFRLIGRVDMLQACMGRDAVPGRIVRLVAQQFVLDHQPDHVDAEAIDAAVEPEAHLVEHGLHDGWVAVIQFRLLLDELVQVILAGALIERPGWPAKKARPVVGWAAVRRGILPDVPVALGIVAAAATLLEPDMFVRGVVGHQVEDQLHAARVDAFQQPVKIGQRAKQGMDIAVIGDIVAKVVHRRRVDRRKPDGADVEALEIVQPLADAGQVADAVAVAVLIRARVNLVNDVGLPPCVVIAHKKLHPSRLVENDEIDAEQYSTTHSCTFTPAYANLAK